MPDLLPFFVHPAELLPRRSLAPTFDTRWRRHAVAAFAASAASLILGCGATLSPSSSLAGTAASIKGQVHGGQQSVTGAHIYLFGAGTSGYGGASVSLMKPSAPAVFTDGNGSYVLTDANGGFELTSTYVCTPGQLMYIVAQGGNPGLSGGANNPALTLVSALGACSDSGHLPDPFINITEITTVAAVYSLSGYMTDVFHLSAPATPLAQQGLANAFLTVDNLVDPVSGNAIVNSVAGNGVAPQATVNTIANMLAACINSSGKTAGCTTLFTNTRNLNGVMPADTATAALNLAHNPGANVVALFNLAVPSPPFQPSLSFAPNDWTVAITFYADLMAGPYYPAMDAKGNLWVPGYANNTLTQFDPLGVPLSGQNGFSGNNLNQPYAIAIDSSQSPWVVNFAYGATAAISRFAPNGSGIGNVTCGNNCTGVAIDSAQNAWAAGASGTSVIAVAGNSVAQFSTAGTIPGLAIDSSGRGWTVGKNRSLLRLTVPGTVDQFPEAVTSSLANDLTLLAIDSTDTVWFTSGRNNALGRVDSSGKLISPATGYTGGGLSYPAQVAIDGSNRVWVANRDGNSISAFHNDGTAISPASGYSPSGQVAPDPTVPVTAVGVRSPHGLAIDGSGNVWVTNFTANSVTEFIGIATPVVTPVSPKTHGQRP